MTRRHHRSWLGLTLACLLAVLASSCAEPRDEAVGLYDEAVALVEKALAEEERSYTSAYKLYQAAINNIATISQSYESSTIGQDLARDRLRIGPFTAQELGARAGATLVRSIAEREPVDCLRYVIGSVTEPANRAKLLAQLAVARFDAGDVKETGAVLADAAAAAREVVDPFDSAMTTVELARAQAATGKVAEAELTVASMAPEQKAARVMALVVLASVHSQEGNPEKADRFFEEAEEVTESIVDSEHRRNWAHGELVAAYTAAADMEAARRHAAAITRPESRARALAAAASITGAGQEAEEADRLLEEALAVTAEVEEPYSLSMSLADISAVYDELGQRVRADDLLSQSLAVAMDIKQFSAVKAGALAKIARKYARAGQYDMAFVITEAMIGEAASDQAWAKAGIAHYFAKRGDFDSALPVILSITREQVRLTTLAEVLLEYLRSKPEDELSTRLFLQEIVHSLD